MRSTTWKKGKFFRAKGHFQKMKLNKTKKKPTTNTRPVKRDAQWVWIWGKKWFKISFLKIDWLSIWITQVLGVFSLGMPRGKMDIIKAREQGLLFFFFLQYLMILQSGVTWAQICLFGSIFDNLTQCETATHLGEWKSRICVNFKRFFLHMCSYLDTSFLSPLHSHPRESVTCGS